ncbi:MAG: UDP-N-acetylmuramate dehydrogenase, partial [Oscillospiraceae bacterium]|nr:UDP-N-acetylmuramate dehydrogenase [Oscillospiraceae bacterium]
MSAILPEGETGLRAECGVTLARLAGEAQRLGLAGLEFAHGIPGSLGGGVSMDAGAYGGELKDVVVSTRYLDEDLNLRECVGAEHDFAYRHSRFSDIDCVILESTVRLTPDDPAAIMERMMTLREKRRASQPLEMPSAGSTFKRPVGGYAAALIDQAGLKGYAIGGAQVSEKHGGFVINRGGATFDDVLRLIDHIRETVYQNSGIRLETEVKIIRE